MYLTRDTLILRYNNLMEQANYIDYRLSEAFDYGESVNYIRELSSEQDALETKINMIEEILNKEKDI